MSLFMNKIREKTCKIFYFKATSNLLFCQHIQMNVWAINKITRDIFLYFLSSDINLKSFSPNWEKAMKNYMCNLSCEELKLLCTISNNCPVQSRDCLTLQQKSSALSSILSLTRAEKASGLVKDEYFISQRKFPRKQLIIICAWKTTDNDLTGDIVLSVINSKFVHTTSFSYIKNKRRQIHSKIKLSHILKYLCMSEEPFYKLQSQDEFSQNSMCEIFKEKQFLHKGIFTRVEVTLYNNNCPGQSRDHLTLQRKFSALSSILSLTRAEKASGLVKDEYFISQRKFPRKQLIIICAWKTTDNDLTGDIVLSVINSKFVHTTSFSYIKNKRRQIHSKIKLSHILKYLCMSEEPFYKLQSQDEFSQNSMCEIFKEKQFLHKGLYKQLSQTVAS